MDYRKDVLNELGKAIAWMELQPDKNTYEEHKKKTEKELYEYHRAMIGIRYMMDLSEFSYGSCVIKEMVKCFYDSVVVPFDCAREWRTGFEKFKEEYGFVVKG